jgi:hypothetical protein
VCVEASPTPYMVPPYTPTHHPYPHPVHLHLPYTLHPTNWISQETAVPPCAGNKRENVLIHALVWTYGQK